MLFWHVNADAMDTKHSFRVNTLLSFCKSVDITYNVSGNPPTPQKITHACIACLCFYKVSNRKNNWGGGVGGRWDCFVTDEWSGCLERLKMVAYNTFGETFSNVTSLIFGFSKAGLCLNNNGNNWTIFCSLFHRIKGLLKHNPSLKCNQVSSMNKYAVKPLISFYSKPLDLHYQNSFLSSSHFLF